MAASSENLAASIDPFLLRHSFSDYFWPTPADNDSLSESIYDDHDFNSLLLQPQPHYQYLNHHQQQHQSLSPFSSSDLEQNQHKPTTTTHPHPLTPSSDPETLTTPKRRAATTTTFNALNGKARITKRKSRATKKNQTTFITADPANFRQMVQQVTGIRFDSSYSSTLPPSLSHFLKPEFRRPVGRLYNACLPTLDTSSFLLDQSQSLIGDRSIYGAGGLNSVGVVAQSGNGGESGYGASDAFACFPTLESWKVM